MFGIRSSDKNSIIHEADTLHNLLLHDNYVSNGQAFNQIILILKNICIVLSIVSYTMLYAYMLYCFYFSLVEVELK